MFGPLIKKVHRSGSFFPIDQPELPLQILKHFLRNLVLGILRHSFLVALDRFLDILVGT